jgi:predicted O-methyltransferase YrrM
LWQARTAYSLHSPFVYQLYTELIRTDKAYYAFSTIEAFRQYLLENTQVIEVQDFGAGSRTLKTNQRKISDIAHTSLATPRTGQLLFKLVNHFQPKTLIELGTSLGISSLYLALPRPEADLHTFEGCPNIARIAQTQFDALHIENIHIHIGNIADRLPTVLSALSAVDFAYLDANHRYEPTIQYFEALLPKFTKESVLILDDIHWSAEMEQAWKTIKQHPQVTLTIDLFRLGLVFFREGQEKQDFVLRF